MQNFESIRPYRDDEVPDVIHRLTEDPNLLRAAAAFLAPRLARALPWLARRAVQHFIRLRTRDLRSVHDVQLWLSRYMARVVRDSIHELTVDGLDNLKGGEPFLFISNHRDIVMDAGLLNFTLYHGGYRTVRSAVGDNLLSEAYAADLMRLNKSFVVPRGVTGTKAQFLAISRTSAYIRHSLEEGESIWIAQREGRAKDGIDRTDPALLKMLALAYRKEMGGFADFVERVRLVPISVSYELDPCDRRKAHSLYVAAQCGTYRKAPNEDVQDMVDGIVGYKGRVHLTIAPPVAGRFEDADCLADALDRIIVEGLRVFPTQVTAAQQLGLLSPGATAPGGVPEPLPRVMNQFRERLEACPEAERPYLLAGYGNVIRNRREIGLDV